MNLSYRRVSQRLAWAFFRQPELVGAAISFDAPTDDGLQDIPPKFRAMMREIPPEMREAIYASYKVEQKKFAAELAHYPPNSLMGKVAAQLGASSAAGKTRRKSGPLSKAGFNAADLGEVLCLGKAWHGLHFLLAGNAWEPGPPPANAVLGGSAIGSDLGYGPARILPVEETVELAASLDCMSEHQLREAFDPASLRSAKIYGSSWEDPDEVEWLLDAFVRLRAYVSVTASKREALLVYMT